MPTTFPKYNIRENSSSSLANYNVFNCPNDFKFGTNTCYMDIQAIQKFGGNL